MIDESLIMTRLDVALQVSAPDHDFATDAAFVWRGRDMSAVVCVQADMFVQVAGVTERSSAEATMQGLVSCVGPQMDLQAVLSGVQLTTEDTYMSFGFLCGQAFAGTDRDDRLFCGNFCA